MMKRKQTTIGKRTLKTKLKGVATPKYEYTSNITISGVGQSLEDERFLKVAVGDKTALLNVDNLADLRSGELKKFTPLGEPLIKSAARTEFLNRAHDAARKKPSFPVATKTGKHGAVFVLPEGLDPLGQPNVERYFDEHYHQYHRRLHRAGTIRGWLKMAALCRGKTRLMTALCLSFSGAVCAEFGYEPTGYQLVSLGGLGKSTIGRIAGTPWGGSLDPTRRIGCGVSWNQTNINLEIVAAALNQMLLFLDNMHRADKKDVEKIIEIMNGEGRGRSTEIQSTSFCVPVVSTSNRSVVSIARDLGMMEEIEALIDRIADIPPPNGCPYMFEGIHTAQQLRDYGDKLRRRSLNFGWAGPEFLHRFGAEIATDRASMQAFADERRQDYRDAADRIKSLLGRDLTRITDRFATSYVAGCLAIRYHILPFTEAEILAALLTCERDHVAFVDQELGAAPAHLNSAHGALTGDTALAGVVGSAAALVAAPNPFERLRRFINRHRERGFINLRAPSLSRLRFQAMKRRALKSKHARVLGYVAGDEYLIPGAVFDEVAGGFSDGQTLKKQLLHRGTHRDMSARGHRRQLCGETSAPRWQPAILRCHSANAEEAIGTGSGAPDRRGRVGGDCRR